MGVKLVCSFKRRTWIEVFESGDLKKICIIKRRQSGAE
jgi:hypothetical protein